MSFKIENSARANVLAMDSYVLTRNDVDAEVFLDANENPFPSAVNRYPDPDQKDLKEGLSKIKGVQLMQMVIGNGSYEILDLLFRVFCEPAKDTVVTVKPSCRIYNSIAKINNVNLVEVPLDSDFNLDIASILTSAKGAKMIVLCSPNNPTGNLFNRNEIIKILNDFQGLVVVDEAYIDFSNGKTFLKELSNYENLFVCQTLSKAYGMAGARIGLGFGNPKVIDLLNKIKSPHNVNTISQNFALARINDMTTVSQEVMQLLLERSRVLEFMMNSDVIEKIYRTDSNFILFKVEDATDLCYYFFENGVIVENLNKQFGCENCLRITIGTHEENERFKTLLEAYYKLSN